MMSMKNALVPLFILVLIGAAAAQPPQPPQPPRRIIVGAGGGPDIPPDWPQPELRQGLTQDQTLEAIAAYAQKLVDTDHLSGALLVAKDGKPLLTRAWGMANATEKNTVDTKFNIGSINKVFTKTAIDQLAAAGKLSYDDTIRKHLPDYPSAIADRVTIQQLLDHRSGMGDIFGPKYMSAPPSRLRENADFLKLFADEPLQFEPGTSQRYSNAGYVVLGLIIEKISGVTYRDYVQKHIFDPAGITNSGFWAIDEAVPHRATGYTLRGPDGPLTKRITNEATLPGRPSSAGGAYSTAGDLLKLFQWLHAARGGGGGGGERGIGVGGGAPGLNAAVNMRDGWTVIVMSNYDPPSAEALARGAQTIIRGTRDRDEGPAPGPGAGGPMRRPPTAPARTDMPPKPVAVSLQPIEHLLAVDARVNGRGPYRFAIDSGAAGLLRVSPELAKTLALEEIGMARTGDPSGKNAREVPIVRVDSVEIGGARFSGVDATVGAGRVAGRDGPPQPDGVIGLGLFAGLTVTLDYPKSELRLSREPLPAPAAGADAAAGAHVVAFTAERGIPQIDIDAANVTLKADVDTGSPALLSVASSMHVPVRGEPRVVGKGRTVSNEFEIRAADLNGDLRIAGWSHPNPTIDIVDLFPVANIGSRFLRQYVVTFDLLNQRLALRQ
jgi:CubicO group peptidase (beta-lactamase class C family)